MITACRPNRRILQQTKFAIDSDFINAQNKHKYFYPQVFEVEEKSEKKPEKITEKIPEKRLDKKSEIITKKESSPKKEIPKYSKNRKSSVVSKYKADEIVNRLLQSSIKNDHLKKEKHFEEEPQALTKELTQEEIDAIYPVYDRLYSQSIKTEIDPVHLSKRKNQSQNNSEESIILYDKISENLANSKIILYINQAFGDKEKLTEPELEEIFYRLGLLEAGQNIDQIEILRSKIKKWRKNQNLYESKLIKTDLIHSATSTKGKFNAFVHQRLNIIFSNCRNMTSSRLPVEPDNDIFMTKHSHLSKKTLSRLLESPKTKQIEISNSSSEDNDFSYQSQLSTETQKILAHSSLAHLNLNEREQKLMEIAQEKKDQLARELNLQKTGKRKKPIMLVITPEEREKIDALKLKRKQSLDQPSYKPKIKSYSEFLKVKEKMLSEHQKPPQYDENIRRHRQGYQMYLKEKAIKEKIHSIPDLPKKTKNKTITLNESLALQMSTNENIPLASS